MNSRDAFEPLDTTAMPWIPLSEGESFKPLRFLPDNDGRILLLRVEPGTVIPLHRHHGEVHAFNVSGSRKLIETGEIVGPGGYVFEPAGNIDSWMAVGDEPAIIHITAYGAMEMLSDGAGPQMTLREIYLQYCADQGLEPRVS